MYRKILPSILILFVAVTASGAPPFYADKLDLLYHLDGQGNPSPVDNAAVWQLRRTHIVENMKQVMGLFPKHPKAALNIKVLEETRFPTYTRRKITFAVERGDRLSAYLCVPHEVTEKTAGIVALHQTYARGKDEVVGRNGSNNLRYGHELAERGYVVIAPDYPRFGDYDIDVYAMGYQSATMKGIWNHMRCVDLLQSLPEVDPERIGVIGHSLGGHNTLFVGVFDRRIKALATSCGFTYFPKYFEGDLTGWTHKGYMPRIASVYGKDPAKMPFDFPEILGALAPRAVFINAPEGDGNFDFRGVQDCVAAAQPVYDLLGAPESLQVAYPDSQHDFPPAQRSAAYAMFDRVLRLRGVR
jgi:dienelactone hydrolase